MIGFVTVAGMTRPGYDPNRNWISQLSLGPGGPLATANMVCCGIWLLLGAEGLRRRLQLTRSGRWAAVLVFWCGACLVVLAALPTDAGIGYPPDVAPTRTGVGFAHQVVAIVLGVAGVAAAVVLGRCLGLGRVGAFVAVVMAVAFVAGSVLVVLDDAGVLPGNPSGLFERVALFTGLVWIGLLSLKAAARGQDAGREEDVGRAKVPARIANAGRRETGLVVERPLSERPRP